MSLVYLFVFNMPLFAQQTNRQIELNRDLIFLVIILLVTLFFISIFKKNKINKKIENELEDRLTERTRELSLMNEKLIVELNEHRLAVEA